MVKVTIASIKAKLRVLGAKLSGNKSELQERYTIRHGYVINVFINVLFTLYRLKVWTENNLDRTLFEVVILTGDNSKFPNVQYEPLEKLSTKSLEWISQRIIDMYFDDRKAQKGNTHGRRLFMSEFLKNCRFHKDGDNTYFLGMCSAEMKRSVDYEVKLHINTRECEIIKAECQCPAGKGPNAACKHVSALLCGIEYYAVTCN